jgi:Ca-activated chloride channel family protein
VAQSFYGLSFPEPEGGIVTVQYPIVFSPGSGDTPITRMAAPRGVVHRADGEAWRERGTDTIVKLRAKVDEDGASRKAHASLVRGLLRWGRFGESLVAARHFADLDPDLPLARELLANAEAAQGNAFAAIQAVAAQVEADPASHRTQVRAAKAYEAVGDEKRACSHWRAAALLRKSDDLRYESLRCTARALGARQAVVDAIRAMSNPAKTIADLLALLEGGKEAPAHDAKHGSPGTFEVEVTCDEGVAACPTALVIGPTGTVLSPWTPGGGRSGKSSVAFMAGQGTYRTLLVGGAPSAKGRVRIRAEDVVRTFAFDRGGLQTVAATDLARGGY